jgi:UDP-N-acetylmuramate dehydrogenase
MDMDFRENISLKTFNTFGLDVKARYFSEASEAPDIVKLAAFLKEEFAPLLILGGGSNVLFTKDFPGTVMKISTKGISVVREDRVTAEVRAEAGENWDDLVAWCVAKGWGGLENLSGIPGNAGTSPVQNIGAYGVEMSDTFVELEAYDLEEKQVVILEAASCRFGYRESIFKSSHKGRYIILSVTFRLQKHPILCLEYGGVRDALVSMKVEQPTVMDVRNAIVAIRARKLPDPAQTGNAGSFFKNPVVPADHYDHLKKDFPSIVAFPHPEGMKLAAAWLIEQCGWKGYRSGDAGVHPSQPLVLVNYGNATGMQILELSDQIRESVRNRFNVHLDTEVNIL